MIQRRVLFILLLCAAAFAARSQSPAGPAWRDSVQTKIKLLRELVQDQNFEDAQIEADAFRTFLRRKYIFFPPAGLSLVSAVYYHNKDRQSAEAALAEAEQNAKNDRNPETKAALLQTILKEHERWENTEQAAALRLSLQNVQDTIAARKSAAKTLLLEKRIDSLKNELTQSREIQSNTLVIDKPRAYLLGGVVALILLALVSAQFYHNSRWKKRWENREREWELRNAHAPLPDPIPVAENLPAPPAAGDVTPVQTDTVSAYEPARQETWYHSEKELPIALVVESNRQIALYVRSLVSSNYEVESVGTIAEALKRAHELLPDLIVCDALLNDNEGIDLVRQVKLSDRTSHIPVILLSRHYGNDGRLDALRAGADAWFTRPIQSDEFNVTIRHLLEQQKQRQEEFARYLQLYYSDYRPELKDRFLNDTIRYIEQDIANADLMPDEIARKLQMSNSHFVRKLKALTAKEPAQLIRELRLEKARFLLDKRAGTPQTISELVGFSNPGLFSMAFKDYFGENTSLLQR